MLSQEGVFELAKSGLDVFGMLESGMSREPEKVLV
jgi:hypothetical protein